MVGVILVGEIGINHNGDMGIAKKLIDVANLAGLDYVKFQKRDINSVYTKEFLDSPRQSPWGTTQRKQKEGIEFSKSDYLEIDNYVKNNTNIKGWFASPWDFKSVNFIKKFNCPYIKIASAMITNFELLEKIKSVNIPVILSIGMSTKEEVDTCLNYLKNQIEYLLMCRSTYPTKDKDMHISFIKTLKKEYPQYKIGFSNHSSGIQGCLVAATLGAEMIEFHITLDRAMYGSDQAASIETSGVFQLAKNVRAVQKILGKEKWLILPDEEIIRKKLRG